MAGLKVDLAYRGEEGLEKWRKLDPDLIVLDIMMPGMDGWEVCSRVRQESSVPILILSARSSEVDMVRGLTRGANDYLCKPFGVLELTEAVNALLEASEYRRPGARSA
jgi:DNA-binding response OmpR family regulator